MTNHIRIVDVSPRDGLQNEAQTLSVETRVELVHRLLKAGVQDIEVGAFVSPRWVPQMAGSDEVLRRVLPEGASRYWVLVPNLRGFQEAVAAGAKHVAVFTAASETFSQKNTNASIAESLERIGAVTAAAQEVGVSVRGYVSCALGCPYEGAIAPEAVVFVTRHLFALGCTEVSIGDTIGAGMPETTQALFARLSQEFDVSRLAAHFHDTRGNALANLEVAVAAGVRVIDASVAGLGGCPYAPGASGNVSTESVLRFCTERGFSTGINAETLAETGQWIRGCLLLSCES